MQVFKFKFEAIWLKTDKGYLILTAITKQY